MEQFPTAFNAAQKFDDDEVVDILEFGTPNMWQSEMVHLGFDTVVANSQELVEFCEHLEFHEDLNQKPEGCLNPARVAVNRALLCAAEVLPWGAV